MRQQQPEVRVARAQVDRLERERPCLGQGREIARRASGPREVIDRALMAAGVAQVAGDLRGMPLARADQRVGHALVQQPAARRLQRRVGRLAHQRMAIPERAVTPFEQPAGDPVGCRERRGGHGERIQLGGLQGPAGDGKQVGHATGVSRQAAQQAADGGHERGRWAYVTSTQRSCALHREQRVAVRRAHRPAHRVRVEVGVRRPDKGARVMVAQRREQQPCAQYARAGQVFLGGVERLGRDRTTRDDQQ